MADSLTQLGAVITEGGIRSTSFFNGRLLSGEDLRREQEAARDRLARLGRAVGAGVAYGLEVRPRGAGALEVTVDPGLAVSRSGCVLAIESPVNLSLVSLPGGEATGARAGFGLCKELAGGVYVAGAGLYLLTLAPARIGEGRAPVSGLGGAVAECNTRSDVEGAQLRLLRMDLDLVALRGAAPARLRNQIAHACLAGDQAAFLASPFAGAFAKAPETDFPAPTGLSACDVALALVHVIDGRLDFVDTWSVRRPIAPPDAAGPWARLLGERRERRAEARLLQFQEQLAGFDATTLASLRADTRFRFLPPVGFLPAGVSFTSFFQGHLATRGPAPLAAAAVEPLAQAARCHPPIDLDTAAPIQLLNVFAPGATTPAYGMFITARLPAPEARYNLGAFNVDWFV